MSKNFLPLHSLKLIYFSLFHSHLIYAIQIWSCCTNSLLKDLFKLQKAAIRIISGSSYNAHTEPLFKKAEILPLPDLVSFFQIQFMQRFRQNFLPESFSDIWTRNNIRVIGTNEIQLRNRDQVHIPYSRLALTDRLPTTCFPHRWEQFPDENIKIIRKITEFDKKLKNYFITDLNSNIICNRLFCPACYRPDNN